MSRMSVVKLIAVALVSLQAPIAYAGILENVFGLQEVSPQVVNEAPPPARREVGEPMPLGDHAIRNAKSTAPKKKAQQKLPKQIEAVPTFGEPPLAGNFNEFVADKGVGGKTVRANKPGAAKRVSKAQEKVTDGDREGALALLASIKNKQGMIRDCRYIKSSPESIDANHKSPRWSHIQTIVYSYEPAARRLPIFEFDQDLKRQLSEAKKETTRLSELIKKASIEKVSYCQHISPEVSPPELQSQLPLQSQGTVARPQNQPAVY